MKKVLLSSFMLLLAFCGTVMAQTRSGKVVDSEGEGIPNVNIVLKGSDGRVGTSTDLEGKYSIDVPDNSVLVFSSTGNSKEVNVGTRSLVDVTLVSQELDELVVVAYGEQKKRDITNSVVSLSSEDIKNAPVTSFEQAMQGKAAGVQINSGSRAGEAITVRVRGTSSISASSQPLYVIDGIPQESNFIGYSGNNAQVNPLSNINPNDIASIQVLKDASAAALYGSRASNGVVLITTKRGEAGKASINVGYYTGYQEATNLMPVMNGSQFTELFNESYENSFGVPNVLGDPDSAINTDWYDEVFRRGWLQELNLSASGGNEKTRFYTGITYRTEEGYTINNDFERLSGRLNLDHKFSNKLSVGTNLSVTRVINNRVSNNNSVASASTSGALQYPNIPVYGDGSELYGPEGEFYRGNGVNLFNNIAYNLVAEAAENYHRAVTVRPLINLFGEYEILENLKFRTDIGLDLMNVREDIYWGITSGDGGPGGVGQAVHAERANWVTNNTLNYNTTFGESHNFGALLGYAFQSSRQDQSNVTGEQFPTNELSTLNSAADITNGGGSVTGWAMESYFARVNYNFNQKYLLEVSARVDGSSKFGKNNRYAFFPAASAGWVISDEKFLDDSRTLSFLKLRSSIGLTGNSDILSSTAANAIAANFGSLGLYQGAPYGGAPGWAPSQFANPDLRWENTLQFDVGADIGLIDNRILLELDYYIKNTTDLLLNVNVPATSGFTSITQNLGKLNNRGFEFALNTKNTVGTFVWNTSFNFAINRNKVTDLKGQIIEAGTGIGRAMEGQPIGAFFTVEYAGVDPNTGDALYYDLDGNVTSQYSADMRKVVGDPNPDFIGGLTNTFSYKGLDLSIVLQFVAGNQVYRDEGRFVSNAQYLFFNNTVDQLDRWQKIGDKTDVPQPRLLTGNQNFHSTRYLEDGSFTRVSNMTLGYSLPNSILKRANLQNVRIFAQAQNFFTFTSYSGHDPEVSSNGSANVGQGTSFFQAPPSKILTFGINIGI